jgi:hypothetical protein
MLPVPSFPVTAGVKIAASFALAVGLFIAGWLANGWRLGAELADVRAEHAGQVAIQATAALSTMKADADAIHAAAQQLGAIEITLGPKIDALKKEIRNAKPLPAGCVPDAGRVRNLDAAIDAANAAAATRQ